MCARMLIIALFVIPKPWKQSTSPSADGWVSTACHARTVRYYYTRKDWILTGLSQKHTDQKKLIQNITHCIILLTQNIKERSVRRDRKCTGHCLGFSVEARWTLRMRAASGESAWLGNGVLKCNCDDPCRNLQVLWSPDLHGIAGHTVTHHTVKNRLCWLWHIWYYLLYLSLCSSSLGNLSSFTIKN